VGQIEDVVLLTRKIESLLDKLGANGRGLHEKLTSVENRLNLQTVKKMRWIATMRNKTMHEHNFQINDFYGFKTACNEVVAELNSLLTPPKKSGCFIATAVYGEYDSPEVLILRKFRDDNLLKSYCGRVIVRLYYFIGSKIAKKIEPKATVARFIRILLDRVVAIIKQEK